MKFIATITERVERNLFLTANDQGEAFKAAGRAWDAGEIDFTDKSAEVWEASARVTNVEAKISEYVSLTDEITSESHTGAESLDAKNIHNKYRVSFIALFRQDFEFEAATSDVAEEYVRAMYREGKFRVDRRTSGDDVSSHLAEAEFHVDRAKIVFEYEYCGLRKALVE